MGFPDVLLTPFFSLLSGASVGPGVAHLFVMDIAAGMLFSKSHVNSSPLNTGVILLIGSIAAVLVLFADAPRINLILK